MAGSAFAAPQEAKKLELTPPADSAATGSCNEFTATLTNNPNTPVEGEVIQIVAAQSDGDLLRDLQIAFCDPDANAPGGNGPGTAAGGAVDCDDDRTTAVGAPVAANGGPCGTPPANTVNLEAPARIDGTCTTSDGTPATPPVTSDPDNAPKGTCSFGVTSNEVGTMTVQVTYQFQDQVGNTVTLTDTSTKTWTAGGDAAVETVDCEPETDRNPEGTQHTITCTVKNAGGDPISDADLDAVITAGPNKNRAVTCVSNGTGAQAGQYTCTYTDQNDGEVGTDTIIVFVDRANTAPAAADVEGSPDANDPQDEVMKNWFGPGRNIDCTPETAENPSGTKHTVTCIVTDREGQTVVGETVTFTEDGTGRFENNQPTNTDVTDANGQVTVVTTTFSNEAGQQSITGALNDAGTAECEAPATPATPGDPQGDPAGNCFDTVVKNWVAAGPAPQCRDGIDNDGDGLIDHPNDPGCASPTDNSEAGSTFDPSVVRHARTIKITRMRHIFLPGKNKPALLIKGVVRAPSFEECATDVPVKVQIRAGGEWITRKTDTTNANGVWKVLIRHVHAKYRARATKFEIVDPAANVVHVCGKATDVRRYSH